MRHCLEVLRHEPRPLNFPLVEGAHLDGHVVAHRHPLHGFQLRFYRRTRPRNSGSSPTTGTVGRAALRMSAGKPSSARSSKTATSSFGGTWSRAWTTERRLTAKGAAAFGEEPGGRPALKAIDTVFNGIHEVTRTRSSWRTSISRFCLRSHRGSRTRSGSSRRSSCRR
jgi:hypothetical protein